MCNGVGAEVEVANAHAHRAKKFDPGAETLAMKSLKNRGQAWS
jgi:hypothetical protein